MAYYLSTTVAAPFEEAVDPVASMERVGNPELAEMAKAIRAKLESVLAQL